MNYEDACACWQGLIAIRVVARSVLSHGSASEEEGICAENLNLNLNLNLGMEDGWKRRDFWGLPG
jgi:hypothetical protein